MKKIINTWTILSFVQIWQSILTRVFATYFSVLLIFGRPMFCFNNARIMSLRASHKTCKKQTWFYAILGLLKMVILSILFGIFLFLNSPHRRKQDLGELNRTLLHSLHNLDYVVSDISRLISDCTFWKAMCLVFD